MTQTFSIVRIAALALIASGFVTMVPAAHAAQADQVPQGELNVAGTDFTSAKAVDHLIARLHRVARDICLPDNDAKTLLSDDERKCVNTALASGLAQIETKRQLALREAGVHVAAATPSQSH
jgi:UrcA family protein